MELKIGQLAQRAGVTHRTIRYYEELALLSPKYRSASRYRFYDESHVRRLKVIKMLQGLGYGLKDIAAALAPLLDMDGNTPPSGIELAHSLHASLSKKKLQLLQQRQEINDSIQAIDDTLPDLSTCMNCRISTKLSDCKPCEVGAEPVRELS